MSDPKTINPRPVAIRTQAALALRDLSDLAQVALTPFNDDVKAAAAELIAGGVPPRSVADRLGIPLTSILMWAHRDPAFLEIVENHVKSIQLGTRMAAAARGIDMINALANDAVDPDVAPADRRASAIEVLRHGGNAPPPPAAGGPAVIVQVDQRTVEARQRMEEITARAKASLVIAADGADE